jgi:arylsulfatase A-like enzyme
VIASFASPASRNQYFDVLSTILPTEPTSPMPNILLITLDQFRADALGCAGVRQVATPHLDRLATHGIRFANHYSQAAPCSPGRASLYTGMYQFNHRVMANGTPLEKDFDNLALLAARHGYQPTVFGYTDQSVDPRVVEDPSDPRLRNYEEFLPGFEVALPLVRDLPQWRSWLISLGYNLPAPSDGPQKLLQTESQRAAEHSLSSFLTDHAIAWFSHNSSPWCVHLSYLRPHPPYAAAGHFSEMYEPADMPSPIPTGQPAHELHGFLLDLDVTAAPTDPVHMSELIAQYYGMISEVDSQIGRIIDHLQQLQQWDETMVILTSDHGEHLGDHGLVQKGGYFGSSYHVPCIIKPVGIADQDFVAGQVIEDFTENIDLFPTICEAIGAPIPLQCDGLPLTEFLRGGRPKSWRDAAHWEFDWRFVLIGPNSHHDWPTDRRLERQHLSVRRDHQSAYVHFTNGDALHFDLAADPTWNTLVSEPRRDLTAAQAMLSWRMEHAPRGLSGVVIENGVTGRPIL